MANRRWVLPETTAAGHPQRGKGRRARRKRWLGPRGTDRQRSSARPLGGETLNRAHGASIQTASRENPQGLQGARTAKSSPPGTQIKEGINARRRSPPRRGSTYSETLTCRGAQRRDRSCRAAVSIMTSVRVRLARGAHNGSGLTESAQRRPPGSNATAHGQPNPHEGATDQSIWSPGR